jgi:hypothetical protein
MIRDGQLRAVDGPAKDNRPDRTTHELTRHGELDSALRESLRKVSSDPVALHRTVFLCGAETRRADHAVFAVPGKITPWHVIEQMYLTAA